MDRTLQVFPMENVSVIVCYCNVYVLIIHQELNELVDAVHNAFDFLCTN